MPGERNPNVAFVKDVGEVWRCEICGNVVEVVHAGGGQLICCGGPMTRVEPGAETAPPNAE